jgi:hypothetical protein
MEQLHLFTPPEPKGRRNQRGAELVEFALIFPVLMLFIIAALSMLWLGFMKVAAAQSAKEAARYASVPVNCGNDLGGPLVSIPAVPPTLPDGSPVPQTVPTVPDLPVTIPPTTVTVPPTTAPSVPDVAVQTPMKLISYQITVPTTVTIPPTTLPITIPPTTLPITIPPTTLPPTTLPPTTLPPTTLPSTTTTTLDPNRRCTQNFRTYPNASQVRTAVDKRVPAGLWGFADGDFDIVYTYNDPSCPGAQPSDHHEAADPNNPKPCETPIPNDPPTNSQVNVKITKTVTGPLGVFASIFNGSNKITANSGGETRGE